MNGDTNSALYSLSEAAGVLGIHRLMITRLLDAGILEGIRTGSRWAKVTRRSMVDFMGDK